MNAGTSTKKLVILISESSLQWLIAHIALACPIIQQLLLMLFNDARVIDT